MKQKDRVGFSLKGRSVLYFHLKLELVLDVVTFRVNDQYFVDHLGCGANSAWTSI